MFFIDFNFWCSLVFGRTIPKTFLCILVFWILHVLSSPFDCSFLSFRSFSQTFIRFELVDQNGIWFKLVNVDKWCIIIEETILYLIRTKPWFFELFGVFLSTLGNKRIVSPIEKVLILWFCWTHNVVFHCLVPIHFTTSLQVSSKCSNSTMWLIKIWVGEKSQLGYELLVGNKYFVDIKG